VQWIYTNKLIGAQKKDNLLRWRCTNNKCSEIYYFHEHKYYYYHYYYYQTNLYNILMPSIYDLNSNLGKQLSIGLRKEMSDNNISSDTILQYETCLNPPWCLHNHKIDIRLSTHAKKKTPWIVHRNLFYELIHMGNHNNTQIYTDASKTSTGIGLAVIHKSSTQAFQLHSHSSN